MGQPPSGEQVITSIVDDGALFHRPVVQPAFNRVVVLIHVRGYPPQCMGEERQEEYNALRLFAVAGFALAVTTSAQAITPAPLPQPDGMITQVRLGCGPFRTRVNGVCVARTTIRHTRRMARRAYRRGTVPQ